MIIIIAAALLKCEERYILKNGVSLTPKLMKIAIALKIKNPEGIRTLDRNKIYGFASIGGMTLNRGILINKNIDKEYRTQLIAHELVHVKQYQDAGGLYAFLKGYAEEVFKYGYWNAPSEIEARIKSELLIQEEL